MRDITPVTVGSSELLVEYILKPAVESSPGWDDGEPVHFEVVDLFAYEGDRKVDHNNLVDDDVFEEIMEQVVSRIK